MPVELDQAMAGPEETLILDATATTSAAQDVDGEHRSVAARQPTIPQFVGPYRLVQLIGEGGMGEVWLAEQLEPLRRRVALKVIKAGMDTKQVVARFASERQALALMDHRAIAKVFDAGATPEGRPYFVMEYVAGVPITEHCDTHKLSTTARLELFAEVCDGVQHAHQKAVIHRDLKPSNILVTLVDGRAQPKIIDFGIAKATGQRLTGKTLCTEAGAVIGTPEYMSPEQADLTGQNVDTRTDVYALGVILYQLLTGELPIGSNELLSSSLEEFRRKLREVEPPRPSTKLSTTGDRAAAIAQNRNTDPDALRWQIEGDLDAITMKALEKEPARRYGTPSDLAADIGRQLRNEPVLARPPSRTYRLQKYVRRHRLGVASASALVLVLLAFTVVLAIQVRRIAYERDRATAELLRGLESSRMPDAERLTRDKLEHQRRVLGMDHRDTIVTLHVLANILTGQDRIAEAEKLQREALELEQRVLGPEHAETLGTNVLIAFGMDAKKGLTAVEKLQRDTFETRRREFGAEHPLTLVALGDLAGTLVKEDRLAEAETLQREKLDIQQRVLGPDHPDTLQSLSRLAATLFSGGRLGEAERLLRETFEARRRVLGPGHPDTIRSMGELATLYSRQGSLAALEQLQREALENQHRLFGSESPKTALARYDLAGTLAKQGKREEALGLLRDALGHGLERMTARGIFEDPDLNSLHGDPRFEMLVAEVNRAHPDPPPVMASASPPAQNRVSSRNGRIAWTQYVPLSGFGLFTSDPDGNNERQLTFPEAGSFNDGHADWSPDGSTIIFERGFDVTDVCSQIYRINADGSALTQIGDCTGDCAGNAFPRYSPDGRKIAFVKAIYPVKQDGNITSAGIWVMNADGTNPVQITQQRVPTSSEDKSPSWSPDGQRLAFGRENFLADPPNHQAIFVARIDGTDLHRITPWELDGNSPDWSSDGRLILFSSHHFAKGPGKTELYTVHPDGSNLVKVIPQGLEEPFPRVAENGRFSPDGKKIIFQHVPNPEQYAGPFCCVLYQVNTDGSELAQFSRVDVAVLDAAWGTHR